MTFLFEDFVAPLWKKALHANYMHRFHEANPSYAGEVTRRYRANNLEKVRERDRMRHANNPEARRARAISWGKQHPENRRAARRRWAKNNPEIMCIAQHRRRARKQQTMGDYTAEQFNALCAHFKHRCVRCGELKKLTADHVIPLAWADRSEFDGVALNDIDNIQPLCKPCNSGKGARHGDHRTTPHRNCLCQH
jgi:5-methylcytosine-specific restriction endonuclease McrA